MSEHDYIADIRRIRSVTPDSDPWEARAVDALLARISQLAQALAVAREALDKYSCDQCRGDNGTDCWTLTACKALSAIDAALKGNG